ncbi:glycerol-3-phosphate acyltransferase [Olsenella uli]|uniref:glycerol-3-phosphate acyltransferase n=1 Tax=Olsenella uli TaxID=133926 RepID=UPI00195CFB85|nr:glycerol-3-phosphate acyltransferase [Olsenella uli]MBM6676811.1 glycerol-3-phosphate acyltransferase [Olsenella uli]
MSELLVPTVLLALGAYVVCGIPFGLIVARAMGHVDVRTTGSGNIGTTNVARSVGKSAAALTLLLDLSKGLVWMLVARLALAVAVFGGDFASLDHTTVFGTSLTVVFLACICGHVFSPYLRFHGGKGIAVGFGAALGLYWPIGLSVLAVFLVLAIPTRYVSLGSVFAAASLPVWCAVYGFPPVAIVPVAVAAVVVVWSHRENVRRLVHGEERRFSFHKSEKGGER